MIISLTCKTLNTTQPPYLYDLAHSACSIITRSVSPYITLIKPSSPLKVTHHSFWHTSLHLWNQLPTLLDRIPHPNYSSPASHSDLHLNMPVLLDLIHTAITFHHFSSFHSELKTNLFRKSYPPP